MEISCQIYTDHRPQGGTKRRKREGINLVAHGVVPSGWRTSFLSLFISFIKNIHSFAGFKQGYVLKIRRSEPINYQEENPLKMIACEKIFICRGQGLKHNSSELWDVTWNFQPKKDWPFSKFNGSRKGEIQ